MLRCTCDQTEPETALLYELIFRPWFKLSSSCCGPWFIAQDVLYLFLNSMCWCAQSVQSSRLLVQLIKSWLWYVLTSLHADIYIHQCFQQQPQCKSCGCVYPFLHLLLCAGCTGGHGGEQTLKILSLCLRLMSYLVSNELSGSNTASASSVAQSILHHHNVHSCEASQHQLNQPWS